MRWLIVLFLTIANPALAASLPVGAPAPDFRRPALNGPPVWLAAYRGKFVLVDFWASWCPPCMIAIPRLIALQKRYPARLKIIGVSMDDSRASARDVAARFAFNYPLVMGDVKFAERYGGILGLPSVFLVGADGRIVKKWRGEFKPGALEAAVGAELRQRPQK